MLCQANFYIINILFAVTLNIIFGVAYIYTNQDIKQSLWISTFYSIIFVFNAPLLVKLFAGVC